MHLKQPHAKIVYYSLKTACHTEASARTQQNIKIVNTLMETKIKFGVFMKERHSLSPKVY